MSTDVVTAAELLAMPDDGRRHELIAGELRMIGPAGYEHGVVVSRIDRRLGAYVELNRLGEISGAETGFLIETNPDTVLAPDVAFVCAKRIASEGLPRSYFPGPPDLAVEVGSPDDKTREVDDKAPRWLRAGVRMVWVIDPVARQAMIWMNGAEAVSIDEHGDLVGGEVVPGCRCSLNEIFPPGTRRLDP